MVASILFPKDALPTNVFARWRGEAPCEPPAGGAGPPSSQRIVPACRRRCGRQGEAIAGAGERQFCGLLTVAAASSPGLKVLASTVWHLQAPMWHRFRLLPRAPIRAERLYGTGKVLKSLGQTSRSKSHRLRNTVVGQGRFLTEAATRSFYNCRTARPRRVRPFSIRRAVEGWTMPMSIGAGALANKGRVQPGQGSGARSPYMFRLSPPVLYTLCGPSASLACRRMEGSERGVPGCTVRRGVRHSCREA